MEMKMNKEKFISKLTEKTDKSIDECNIIYDILNKNGIIGRKNKEKIKEDFIKELNISKSEANNLYNICMEIVVNNFFK